MPKNVDETWITMKTLCSAREEQNRALEELRQAALAEVSEEIAVDESWLEHLEELAQPGSAGHWCADGVFRAHVRA